MNPDELSADDYLSFLVGAVARADVEVELLLLLLWRRMSAPDAELPYGFSALLEECQSLLPQVEPPDDVLTAGADALGAASTAHARRNRVVHDMWFSAGADEEQDVASTRFDALRLKARDYLPVPTPAWPVEEMEAARWSIRKARLRVYYLLAVLGMPIHLDPGEARTFAVGMVEGRFEVGPSGIDDEEARNP